MQHNPTYRFRDKGPELRAQTKERGHCCSCMIERGDAKAKAKFVKILPLLQFHDSCEQPNSSNVRSLFYLHIRYDSTLRNEQNCTAF